MKTLEQLQRQKEYWGFLEGQDAQEYLAHIRDTRADWTEESIPRDYLELVRISELAPGEKKMSFAAFQKVYSVSGSSKVEAA
jgi:hypothetical protein